jgi:hypothetical protein
MPHYLFTPYSLDDAVAAKIKWATDAVREADGQEILEADKSDYVRSIAESFDLPPQAFYGVD